MFTRRPNNSYTTHVARLQSSLDSGDARAQAVGGEFDAVGKLEYHLLRSLGLQDGHLVIDVGCGSGRLACQLAPFEAIRYLGIDVVPQLIELTKQSVQRDDWRLEVTDGINIPCGENTADFVVAFSVFTHLRHEETYQYFREAARCLRLGGRMILSFLEFRVPCHWTVFMGALNASPEEPVTQFIDRDAVRAWASHSGLLVAAIFDGDRPHIPIPEEVRWENGIRMESLGNLGQSVAVLRKV